MNNLPPKSPKWGTLRVKLVGNQTKKPPASGGWGVEKWEGECYWVAG